MYRYGRVISTLCNDTSMHTRSEERTIVLFTLSWETSQVLCGRKMPGIFLCSCWSPVSFNVCIFCLSINIFLSVRNSQFPVLIRFRFYPISELPPWVFMRQIYWIRISFLGRLSCGQECYLLFAKWYTKIFRGKNQWIFIIHVPKFPVN